MIEAKVSAIADAESTAETCMSENGVDLAEENPGATEESKNRQPQKKKKANADLTEQEQRELDSLEAKIREGLSLFLEIGEPLAKIKQDKLYRAKYISFQKYCTEEFEISFQYAYRMVAAFEVKPGVDEQTSKHALEEVTSERHLREFVKVKHDLPAVFEDLLPRLPSPEGNEKRVIPFAILQTTVKDRLEAKKRSALAQTGGEMNELTDAEPAEPTESSSEDPVDGGTLAPAAQDWSGPTTGPRGWRPDPSEVQEIIGQLQAGNKDTALRLLEKLKEKAENAEQAVSREQPEMESESEAPELEKVS